MKLRNKKTGEIKELPDGFICNIKQLCEEWEDYEEPKDHYYIDYDGDILTVEALDYEPKIKIMQSIGNYFETKEEAEQAVEKLKAWKRLQDAGLIFHAKVIDCKWYLMPKTNKNMCFKEAHQLYKDINLVFGVKYNEGIN